MSKKILVLCGHPNADSLTGYIADRYQAAAEDAAHEVVRLNVGELTFDPILHNGYREIQSLEPDLEAFQEHVRWAEHIVIVYPNWLCSMPAALKGLFDRTWQQGFAYDTSGETGKQERLLAGRTARIIVLSGALSPFMSWWRFGDFTNEIQYGVFGVAGIRSEVTAFGPSDDVSEATKERWVKLVEKLASKAN